MLKSNKKEFNRESLLNQGVVFFMNQGYHGTGLQEILDAVNVPKGSFYNYFSSKEEFGAAVIQHYIEPFISRLSAQGGCLLGSLMGEIGSTSDVCQQSLQSAIARYRDLLQSGLAQAQQQGSVRTDKPSAEMADLLNNA